MSDFDHRNKAFDYAPPTRTGGSAAVWVVGGIILLFILALLFMGGDTAPPTDGGVVPGPDGSVGTGAPALPADPSAAPAPAD